MSRATPSTVGRIIYDGVAYPNAAFWLFCTAGIKSNVADIRNTTFDAMQKVGMLTPLEREFDSKSAIREAQLIFSCLAMSLLALAGVVAATKNIIDGVRNPVVGTAKKLSLAYDGVAFTNAAAWLILTALTAGDVGHSRQMTLNAMVNAGALESWEAELDPKAGIRAAQLLFGMATMFPFAARHMVADASKVVHAIGRFFSKNEGANAEAPAAVVTGEPVPADVLVTRTASNTDDLNQPLLLSDHPEILVTSATP